MSVYTHVLAKCFYPILGLFLSFSVAFAEEKSLSTPDAVSVATNRVDVELFAAQPTIQRPNISPSGQHIAGLIHVTGKPVLWIKELFGDDAPLIFSGGQWKIRW